MDKILKGLPFVLLVLYYVFIADAKIAQETKYTILFLAILISAYAYLRVRGKQLWSITSLYLVASILGTVALALYFAG